MLQTVLIFFLIICFQANFCPQIKSVKKWLYASHTSDMGPTQVTDDSYQFLINIIFKNKFLPNWGVLSINKLCVEKYVHVLLAI